MVQRDINAILDRLHLTRSQSPAVAEWQAFLSDINKDMSALKKEKSDLQAILELGSQETQKVWDLIQEREFLIKSILDSSQDIILVLDQECQIIEFNGAAEDFFKVSKAEIAGSSVFQVIKGGKLFADLKSLVNNLNVDHFLGCSHESSLIAGSTSEIVISVFPKRMRLSQGDIYSIYFRDLTKTKEIEKQLEDTRAQMISSSKLSALGEMAGGVAHEVNNPLAIIQLRADQMLERIASNDLDATYLVKSLEGICQTVKRISDIVNALRSFSKDGKKEPRQPHEISSIIDETFLLCREKFQTHGVKLERLTGPEISIPCRPTEIAQVLLNLLNNSYDAIRDLPEKWISVGYQDSDGFVLIRVTDSGAGIAQEVADKMMQPFFTTKPLGKGTGLGLSISKGLIESSGGELSYNSSSPNTQFLIRLPKG